MADILSAPPGLSLPDPMKVKAADAYSKSGSVIGKKGKAQAFTETTGSDLGDDSLTDLSGAESVASLSDFDSSASEKVEPDTNLRRYTGRAPAPKDWNSSIAKMNALDLMCAGGKPKLGLRKKAHAISRAPLKPLPPAAKVAKSHRGPPGFDALPKKLESEPMRIPTSAPLKLDLLVKSGPGSEATFQVSSTQELAEWGRAAFPVELSDQAWDSGAQAAWEAMVAWQAQDASAAEWGAETLDADQARPTLNPKARLFVPGS